MAKKAAGSIRIFRGVGSLLTLEGAARKGARHTTEADLGLIEKAAFVEQGGRLLWVGPQKNLSRTWAKQKSQEIDLGGATACPGLVECHTHLVFAGSRAEEFEARLQGVSYQEIAAKGGGILSTVRRTREASVVALAEGAQKRAEIFLRQGVTTLEIKSGYGLDLKSELKMLEAAGRVKGPRVVRTFLGAHAKPPEFETPEAYLEHLQEMVLPAVKKKNLAERVDAFIEKNYFPPQATKEFFRRAQDLGFEIVVHADQLSLSGGSQVAVEVGARSADHVIEIGPAEIQNLARSEVTCVLLPAADFYLRCPYPPARALIEAGARVALATDFNPGTSPTQDVDLVGLLARLEMKMSWAETLVAYTLGAAWALGRAQDRGSLEVGKLADFFSIEAEPNSLFYSVGDRRARRVFLNGREQRF